jgi:hypothetical protein
LFDEGTMYMITASEAGVDFNDLSGLLDVNFLNGTVGATTYTADLKLDYGTALNLIAFSGAVSADFDLYNNTTAGTVAVTSAETTPGSGNYTFTFAAQTTGDSLTLSIDKDGFTGSVTFTAV